jgi:hypothetical protein
VVIEPLRQLVNDADGHQWIIGDYLVDVVDELEAAYSGMGLRNARAWLIRHMAIRVGADTSTLRDRASMCTFYPPDVRREYDALSYHQLRACKSAKDKWREYADWAMENLPAPVALIRARVKHNGDLPPAWIGRWERVLSLADLLADDAEAPAPVRLWARVLGMVTD